MTNLMRVCRALYLSVGLTLGFVACASDPADPIDPPAPDPEAVERVPENLERLRALQVFQVGDLVVENGESEVAAATDLETFAVTAENACVAVETDASACTADAIERNLVELRAMSVVEVGDLLAVEPANNPNCYNLPCEDDVAAAEAETCARATKLANIVEATKSQY
jgi:hypothetical protein